MLKVDLEAMKELLETSDAIILDDCKIIGEYPIDDFIDAEVIDVETREKAVEIIKANFRYFESLHKNGGRSLYAVSIGSKCKNLEDFLKRNELYAEYLEAYHEDFEIENNYPGDFKWNVVSIEDIDGLPKLVFITSEDIKLEKIKRGRKRISIFSTNKKHVADKYYDYMLERIEGKY
jgi:hypothetical protein